MLFSLSVVANITTISSSASDINKKFMDNMSTKKLISALNTACGCSDYNGISISFLSAEDYCIDKNTPTELCSYGHIKTSPYLTAVRNYSFEQTDVEGVDFGDCAMLEEIGTLHHSCLTPSLTYLLTYLLTASPTYLLT